MKKIKVTVKKLGKRISWNGLTLATPCKFFINENDQTHIKVLMKRSGINTDEYFFGEAKEQSEGIKKANKAAEDRAKKSAKEAEKAVKEGPKVEVKKEVKKEEKKPEAKKEQPKHFNKNKKK